MGFGGSGGLWLPGRRLFEGGAVKGFGRVGMGFEGGWWRDVMRRFRGFWE